MSWSRCRAVFVALLLVGGSVCAEASAATSIAPASSIASLPLATLQQQAARGNAEAEVALGVRLMQSKNPADKAEAVAWYRSAAAKGSDDAKWLLGMAYVVGAGTARDAPAGLKLMRETLDDGSAVHMLMYGMLELSPVGESRQEGAKWLHRSAAAGSTNGMMMWALLEFHGNKSLGVAANPVAAKRWLLKAADLGNPVVEWIVGFSQVRGNKKLGFARNTDAGLDRLNKAAAQGYTQAEGSLGMFLITGEDNVPKDPATGVQWAEKAAASHDVYGYYALGFAYQHGLGGEPVDPAKAWYNFAAAERVDVDHALSKVAVHLSEVGGKLSATQLDQLQTEVSKIPLPKKNQQT